MLQDTVQDDDIAEIVAKWTGIPVDKLLTGMYYTYVFYLNNIPMVYTYTILMYLYYTYVLHLY
jgi:hypothetical protein